ncbi:hypothetical protein KIL84_016397 [Mauremys mutica]|uniref:Uncharacterized protein n=1 Tax=Mauremys mutica TaxID=74926 RepID=A0A9D4AVT3_9SAUR|nr:hypothetical protein KIL84_016397 [Mauremys mutica]
MTNCTLCLVPSSPILSFGQHSSNLARLWGQFSKQKAVLRGPISVKKICLLQIGQRKLNVAQPSISQSRGVKPDPGVSGRVLGHVLCSFPATELPPRQETKQHLLHFLSLPC